MTVERDSLPKTGQEKDPLPTGTVTFLFTDIEGSTRLWQAHRSTMPRIIERHDRLLRDAVERNRGAVFKTVGDAVCASFASASDALHAALDGQRKLRDETWQDGIRLRVRMALHTGPVGLQEGEYRGHTLNRVARILSAGHGGQILLSLTTAELVRDEAHDDVQLHDLGEHGLKDLAHPEHLFQAVAPDLPSEFPALKTLAPRSHLPIQSTPLIGRVREVEDVCALLRSEAVRLVTLTGPGGAGKSRLSLEVAARLENGFPDGAFFVALAPVHNSDLVPSAIAAAIGLQEIRSRAPLDALAAHLREKAALLVLDNFEHLLDASTAIGRLLASCPRLKSLVTSRAALRLSAEHDYPLPLLAAPPPTAPAGRDTLAEFDATALFVDRARAARADLSIADDDAEAIAEICRRLDGLPLAIELAAARIRLFPPRALLERLDHRLKLLTGGARDRPERQQTVRGAIDWSYSLLAPAEQRLFNRLSVFAGGCTLEAAEAVCTQVGDCEVDILDGMASLVDQSLIRREDGWDGEPRFTMLQTVREYALEKLDASGEGEAVWNAHAQWLLELVGRSLERVRGADQITWVRLVHTEYDNLRAAMAFAIQSNQSDLALQLAACTLPYFLRHRERWTEGRLWAERALALPGSDRPSIPRAWGLLALGRLSDDIFEAQTYLQEGIDLARSLGPETTGLGQRSLLGFANLALAWTYIAQGDLEKARALLEEGLALTRQDGDDFLSGIILHGLGSLDILTGDLAAAHTYLDDSLATLRRIAARQDLATPLNSLGDLARAEGNYQEAGRYYKQSLELQEEYGLLGLKASVLHNLGYVSLRLGEVDAAHDYFSRSMSLFKEQGDRRGAAECLAGLGGVATARGQPVLAARLFGASERALEDLGTRIYGTNLLDHDRSVAATRAQLSDDEFKRAWEAGRTATQEHVLSELVDEA